MYELQGFHVRRITALVMVVFALGSCSEGTGSNVEELEDRIAELEAIVSSTTVPTTTQPTTTTLETLSEAADLWCQQNPYLFARGAVVLGPVGESLLHLLDSGGKTYFWFFDGFDIFSGRQKFDSLPNNWFEYPLTHMWMQEAVEDVRSTSMGETEYLHACNVAFEMR